MTLVVAASASAAQPRIALVIGNSAYRDIPLANPANDARLMADVLGDLGFDVTLALDADQKAMKYAIVAFGERLAAAGKDAVGLFFYAGHGLQVNGQNYLVPLAAEIDKESHVAIEAVSAGWVLGEMEFAGNRMNFVILDACRNNPLSRSFRSATRGLARMDAPRGSIVAYSTAPGQVARDGEGFNSPYTEALVREMRAPGVSVERMFKQVRIAVMADTDDQQVPWESSSLTGDFSFAPDDAAADAPEPTAAPAIDPAEQAFWQAIAESQNPSDYSTYLRAYPDGVYAPLARVRIEGLQALVKEQATREASTTELAFWDAIKDSGNADDYEAYLDSYADGKFAVLARNRIDGLKAAEKVAASDDRQAGLVVAREADASSNPDAATASTGGTFDGKWILSLKNERCPLIGKTTATIVSQGSKLSGTVKITNFGNYKVSGSIGPLGDLEGLTLQGRYLLKLKGSISGDEGKGKWRVAGEVCDGSFSLARIVSD